MRLALLPLKVVITTDTTVTYEKATPQNKKPILTSFVTAQKPDFDADAKKDESEDISVVGKVAKKLKKNKKCRKPKKMGKGGDKTEVSGSFRIGEVSVSRSSLSQVLNVLGQFNSCHPKS